MDTFRTWFDARFAQLLAEKIAEFQSHSPSIDVATIAAYAATLGKDGKRFRPFLVHTASGATLEQADEHFFLYASVELLHLFALIHDDIMDRADTRHGVLCAHRVFTAQYGARTAEAVAILLGDIVLVWAYDCLFDYTMRFPDTRDAIANQFKQLVSEVTHGQILDVLSPVLSPQPRELIEQKMILKTGRYSFVQPLMLGCIVSGITDEKREFANTFGTALGVGFQLQDDLIDLLPSSVTGKSSCGDIIAGQQTLLSWYMEHKASPEHRAQFAAYRGLTTLSDTDRDSIRALVETSGAYDFVRAEIDRYMQQATQAINNYGTDTALWQQIVELVATRKK
jgi:geranylgeranyl diphosphate synthase type I